jgi:hypothetical protein
MLVKLKTRRLVKDKNLAPVPGTKLSSYYVQISALKMKAASPRIYR